MDTLTGTVWDVLIVGTGIAQSLLALALSRSGKSILHIDERGFYGGAEAALSLQEATEWITQIDRASLGSRFENASIEDKPKSESPPEGATTLSFSRAYSLALAPQLIYTDSRLLSSLVTSKAHKQLEFLPMGCFWVYSRGNVPASSAPDGKTSGKLVQVPTTREDVVFSDPNIDIRARRALMRVIRFIIDYEHQPDIWQSYSDKPLTTLLREKFSLRDDLHTLLLAITLTLDAPEKVTTSYALPRLARHLRSTGRLGPGFSSIIPRWGGVSEICQVACRAAAVRGAVYVLNKSIVDTPRDDPTETSVDANGQYATLHLGDGETVKAASVVVDRDHCYPNKEGDKLNKIRTGWSRSITIIDSPLAALFPQSSADAPSAAGTVVVFPSGSLPPPLGSSLNADSIPPVYLIIHNHDSGECPFNQCMVYGVTATNAPYGHQLLDHALQSLFVSIRSTTSIPRVLWTLRYEQTSQPKLAHGTVDTPVKEKRDGPIVLQQPMLDLVFDDTILDSVKQVWADIVGSDVSTDSFLVFEDRSQDNDDEGAD